MADKNVLILDKDMRALNVVTVGEASTSFVFYDGPFYPGGLWDGEKIVDPIPPPEPEGVTASAASVDTL